VPVGADDDQVCACALGNQNLRGITFGESFLDPTTITPGIAGAYPAVKPK